MMVVGGNRTRLQKFRACRLHGGKTLLARAAADLITLTLAAIASLGIVNPLRLAAQTGPPAPSPAASVTPPASLPRPSPTPSSESGARLPSASDVTGYLGSVISWYRDQYQDAGLVREPAEALIAADERSIADNIVELAFDAARAATAVINQGVGTNGEPASASATTGKNSSSSQAPIRDAGVLAAKQSEGQAQIARDNAAVVDLQNRLRRAPRRERAALGEALANAQARLQLDQSRLDAISAIAEFESTQHAGGGSPGTLLGQIGELQRTVAPAGEQSQPATVGSPPGGTAEPSGLLGNLRILMELMRKSGALEQAISRTAVLRATAEAYRAPIAKSVTSIYDQALDLAKDTSTGDYAAVQQNSNHFQQLAALHKLLVPALLPLTKQDVLLNLYMSNLQRWRSLVDERLKDELRELAWRVGAFAVLFALVAGGAITWRRLTFRYIQDLQRRHILMQLRRVAVGIIVALIIIFGFASELGTLGTVLGLAAAGIALALQNVILSLAGYFYLSGRYGIRVNDRIQLSGISGDVLEIGLFRMTLIELTNDDFGFQPTGRVVVFPNSVVFQPNGNFYKQLPGTSFMWAELRLTLAPDCDYRLAEKRILEVVNDVFARYRDLVQRESRRVELDLNVRFETPKPQSRIELRASGLAMVIRYPVPLQNAVQTADEIARRLVDAISREPDLELATQGTPSLRPIPVAAHPATQSNLTKADAGKPRT
jgi:small-conductance mechanosensitive channel